LLLSVAGGVTVTGVVAQVLLDGLYIESTGPAPTTANLIVVTGALLAVILVVYVILDLRRLPQAPAQPTTYRVEIVPPAAPRALPTPGSGGAWSRALVLVVVALGFAFGSARR
jgi:hypothetical protein